MSMKEIHLRRHSEKGPNGLLTPNGEEMAKELGRRLPEFAVVIASDSPRAQLTAQLLTGKDPVVDSRAGFYMASQQKSDDINRLSVEQGLSFLEAAQLYQDAEVLDGIDAKATTLNQLIVELLRTLGENEKALIVSHDLSISPAMAQKGIPLESIDPLEGYIVDENGTITQTSPQGAQV